MAKLITVFGATGNQGGSVIRAILADPKLKGEFNIRGVTRDLSKPAAEELKKMGVELVNVCIPHKLSILERLRYGWLTALHWLRVGRHELSSLRRVCR